MTNKILNWGLLSTARINRALIPPLQISKRNHLTAVASRSQETADAYAKGKKIPRAYGSYEALLADPEIDVIYNSAAESSACRVDDQSGGGGQACAVRKTVGLERGLKWMRSNAAARKHGRVVAEAFMYRHHPQTLKVQEIVKSGSLGTLKLIRGSFSFISPAKRISVCLTRRWVAEASGMLGVILSATHGLSSGRNRLRYLAGR